MSSFIASAGARLSVMKLLFLLAFVGGPSWVNALGLTDTYTSGGDNSRSGYQTNHNMDPNVVGSDSFGQLWKSRLTNDCGSVPEQIFSQPLVYTPGDTQFVYIASTTNAIYKINAKTGAIVTSRTLHVPFLQKDLDGCTDLQPCIGVTATGTIDPASGVWYFTAKTYADQTGGTTGRLNGRYFVHAVDVNTLAEKPGFPIALEGLPARNNPKRLFISGNQHQRPALVLESGYIYAGFASHCVQYNFSGWMMGWSPSGQIVESFATQGGPEDITVKGGGIWMGGGGISSDGKGSMWVGTGNGYASQLHGIPVPGRQPPSALEEAAVHFTVQGNGSLAVIDFFMPFEKEQLDGADKDLGTSPLVKLPESTFSCGSVKRIGVITGKSGKTYFLNLDDLGGYQNGPNKGDKVIFTYLNQNSVYSGAAVYPLEGGYVYIHVVQFPTTIFKFSCGADGAPTFTYVGQTADKNAFILGVGHGTTTSLNNQPGTGLVWVTDVQGFNLRVYSIVSNGLKLIKTAQIPGTTKFTRPVLGDGRVYVGTTQGLLYAFGSPVNAPLQCSSPIDFGTTVIGNASQPITIQCKANITTTVTSISISSVNFNISNLPTLPLTVNAGNNFSFNGIFKPTTPGPLADDVIVNTTNSVAQFSTRSQVTLKGIGNSLKPIIQVTPNTVSFEGVLTGQNPNGVDNSVIFINQGSSLLTIANITYSLTNETGAGVTPNTTANGTQVSAFTFTNIPTTIDPNSQVIVNINFNPPSSGNYAVYVTVNSNGGSKVFTVVGTSGDQPKALLEFLKPDGSGWVPYSNSTPFSFGDVYEQTTLNLQMRLTNVGGPQAGRLSVTVSKPPIVAGQIVGARNNVDLGEGTTLLPGESANATLFCSVPKSQVNVPDYNATAVWTMNTGDPNFGKQDIQFYCHAIAEQVGPLQSNGSAQFPYVGCYKENNPGRQLDSQRPTSGQTIDQCIKECNTNGFRLAGIEYSKECWCSNTKVPVQRVDDANCNFACTANASQLCGGNGVFHDGSYISLFGDRKRFDPNNPNLPDPNAPKIPQTSGNYGFVTCADERNTGRLLNGQSYSNSSNSVDQCAGFCAGFKYFGVEYGQECYCGNTLKTTPVTAPNSDCNTLCPGNQTVYCGNGGRLQLYQLGSAPSSTSSTSSVASSTSSTASSTGTANSTDTATTAGTTTSTTTSSTSSATPTQTGPIIVQSYNTWGYTGCYNEVGGRALNVKSYSRPNNTVERCADFCAGSKLFAVEYGVECYCGTTLKAGSTVQPDKDCNMLCGDNKLQYCGGGSRLQLYTFGTANVTSSSSSTSTAAPTGPITTGTTTSTDTATTSATSTNSTTTSATSTNSTTAATDTATSTNTTTSSTATSTDSASTTSTSSSTSTTSSTTSSVSSSAPTSTPSNSPWVYLGCANEANPRALSGSAWADDGMTVDKCQAYCVGKNFPLAGVEYGRECYCGNQLQSGSTVGQTGCTTPCAGNNTQICGGNSRLNVYNYTQWVAPRTVANVGTYMSQGCYKEVAGRAINGYSFTNNTGMTVELCIGACQSRGFTYGGLEYSVECYCGNTLSTASTKVDISQCNKLCSGDRTEYCGAGSLLNVYMKNPQAIQSNGLADPGSTTTKRKMRKDRLRRKAEMRQRIPSLA